MASRRRWIVGGRVQGVFFRESTRLRAEEIGGLSGTVRNLSDATVEVIAEGPPEALAALLAYLKQGPGMARVDSVTEGPAPAGALGPGFRVLRS